VTGPFSNLLASFLLSRLAQYVKQFMIHVRGVMVKGNVARESKHQAKKAYRWTENEPPWKC
jgi:hypothetical protein